MEFFGPVTQPPFSAGYYFLAFVIAIWTYFWKGVALWRASRGDQMYWFIALIALFPVNLFGIIELLYLFKFARKPLTIGEIKSWKEYVTPPTDTGKKSVKKK